MKKYLIYSDPHFCQFSSIIRKQGKRYSVRLHNLIESISWVEKEAEKENCDEIVCLGDFFDRADISAPEITALQEVYFSNIPHTILTGNHDSNVANLYFSAVKVFESKGANIITEPVRVEVNDKVDLYYIPYISDKAILPIKSYLVDNDKKKIVLSHNDIAGIRYGRYLSETGFEVKDINKNCTLFLNGHLHNGYVIEDNIVLVGNLTGLNFNEDANKYKHYIYLLTINDDGTIELEPRINPYAFNFYKIYIKSEEDLSKIDALDNNAVVSTMCVSNLLTKADKKLNKSKKIVEYKLIAMYDEDDDEDSLDFTVEDHMKLFIDFAQTKIEPSKILTEELSLLGR